MVGLAEYTTIKVIFPESRKIASKDVVTVARGRGSIQLDSLT
jgi:hypothetical protein